MTNLHNRMVSWKIADFGLAKLLNPPDLHAHSVVGTLNYMAPEVFLTVSYSIPSCQGIQQQ